MLASRFHFVVSIFVLLITCNMSLISPVSSTQDAVLLGEAADFSVSISTQSKDWIPIFQECLANTVVATTGDVGLSIYTSENERETCRKLVQALEDDELMVHAANTSYAFWYLSTQINSNNNNGNADNVAIVVTDQDRLFAAMKEARRHYVYMNRDFDKALKNLTESCQFRKVRITKTANACIRAAFGS
jgi:hypothetical protein